MSIVQILCIARLGCSQMLNISYCNCSFQEKENKSLNTFALFGEKEWDLTQTYDKTLVSKENSKTNGQPKDATKIFHYTPIAVRLRTVSWNNNIHPTDVIKLGLKGNNLPTHRKSIVINRTWHGRKKIQTYFHRRIPSFNDRIGPWLSLLRYM